MAPYWEVSADDGLVGRPGPVRRSADQSNPTRRVHRCGQRETAPLCGRRRDALDRKQRRRATSAATRSSPARRMARCSLNCASRTMPRRASIATFTAVSRNPIITTPYQLSEQELSSLGDKHIGVYYEHRQHQNRRAPAPASPRSSATREKRSASHRRPAVRRGAGHRHLHRVGQHDQQVRRRHQPIGLRLNSGPYCGTNYTLAPTQDLKLLTDIISAAGTHPAERQNSHQTGNAVNALSSAARAGTTPATQATARLGVPGAVISGHIAYVTGGRTATLRAYDIYPSEDLDGDGNPDDGDTRPTSARPTTCLAGHCRPVRVRPDRRHPAGRHNLRLCAKTARRHQVYGFHGALPVLPLANLDARQRAASQATLPRQSRPRRRSSAGASMRASADGSLFVYDFNARPSAVRRRRSIARRHTARDRRVRHRLADRRPLLTHGQRQRQRQRHRRPAADQQRSSTPSTWARAANSWAARRHHLRRNSADQRGAQIDATRCRLCRTYTLNKAPRMPSRRTSPPNGNSFRGSRVGTSAGLRRLRQQFRRPPAARRPPPSP